MSDETNDDLLGGIEIESTKDLEVPPGIEIESTKDLEVPPLLIDQVIGQEHASEIIKKAAQQRRHVMLIGTPGTGKSMLAQAMAELLPKEELKDVLIYHNPEDANNPRIREVRAGKGVQIINAHKIEAHRKAQLKNTILMIVGFAILLYAASLGGMALLWGILAVLLIMVIGRQFVQGDKAIIPKLIVNNANKDTAPSRRRPMTGSRQGTSTRRTKGFYSSMRSISCAPNPSRVYSQHCRRRSMQSQDSPNAVQAHSSRRIRYHATLS
jgi:Lon-like ATP-dependent protease